MRIAISGSHATGKSTLIGELAPLLPHYTVVEEPYYALADEGHAFAGQPSADDYELQLERSIDLITGVPATDVLFERSPIDYLAYLAALPGEGEDAAGHWFSRAAEAVARLDLIVFVPIEQPDRIEVGESEGRRLRKRVDAKLRELLVDDAWGLGAPVLEVRGTPPDRAWQVARHLGLL